MPQNRLREIRESRGLTQAQLAAKMNTTSVTVGRWEKQDQRLDLTILSSLARALNCTIAQLAGEAPIDVAPDAPAIDRARMSATIDALDHYLVEQKLRVAAGGRGDLILAIYDWSEEQRIPVDEIRDLSRIGPLLRPMLNK